MVKDFCPALPRIPFPPIATSSLSVTFLPSSWVFRLIAVPSVQVSILLRPNPSVEGELLSAPIIDLFPNSGTFDHSFFHQGPLDMVFSLRILNFSLPFSFGRSLKVACHCMLVFIFFHYFRFTSLFYWTSSVLIDSRRTTFLFPP